MDFRPHILGPMRRFAKAMLVFNCSYAFEANPYNSDRKRDLEAIEDSITIQVDARQHRIGNVLLV